MDKEISHELKRLQQLRHAHVTDSHVTAQERLSQLTRNDLRVVVSETNDEQLRTLLSKCCHADIATLNAAISPLRMYMRAWQQQRQEPRAHFTDEQLRLTTGAQRKTLASSSAEMTAAALARQKLSGEVTVERQSIFESGADSGASDSGVGSNVSQASLPTTTPPTSPGYMLSAGSKPHEQSRRPNTSLNRMGAFDFSQQRSSVGSAANASSTQTSKPVTPPVRNKWTTAQKAQVRAAAQSDERYQMAAGAVATSDSIGAVTTGFPSPPTVLARSRSHESHLSHRVRGSSRDAGNSVASPANSCHLTPHTTNLRGSHAHRGSADQAHLLSPAALLMGAFFSAQSSSSLGSTHRPRSPSTSLMPPRSPRSGRMMHAIPHHWERCRKFTINRKCDCCKQALTFKSSEKCISCKIRVHVECKAKIGNDTCGLTKDMLKAMLRDTHRWEQGSMLGEASSSTAFVFPDDANSTGSSSTPSTPAAASTSSTQQQSSSKFFQFSSAASEMVPDRPSIDSPIEIVVNAPSNVPAEDDLTGSQTSDKTVHVGSQSSSQAVVNKGDTSQQSSTITIRRPHSAGENLDGEGSDDESGDDERQTTTTRAHRISRNSWSAQTIRGQPTSAWTDFTIKYEDIHFKGLVGQGHFGEVHRGYWYQEVAVKLLDMDHIGKDQRGQIEAFKEEVGSFKNTRHENIVLFLGYCLVAPKLGIVMNFCRGKSLYAFLHQQPRTHTNMDIITKIGMQICQGMSYLHGRNIVHKDLRTKNIFIEPNTKVVITDFGLFSMGRLYNLPDNRRRRRNHVLHVPDHWLCYLAPELIRGLIDVTDLDKTVDYRPLELPFSNETDVYSFGTVWYELLSGEMPFARRTPESVVWMVGRGARPALTRLSTVVKEAHDLLVQCWAFDIAQRPDFNELHHAIDTIPKKYFRQLQRSPSHPVGGLSRSAESLFM